MKNFIEKLKIKSPRANREEDKEKKEKEDKEKKEKKEEKKEKKEKEKKEKEEIMNRERTKSLSPRKETSRKNSMELNLDQLHETLENLKLSDFVLIDELASGFLGHVYLARCEKNKCYYVLKQMKKKQIIKSKQLERVFNEKKIHNILCEQNVHQVVKLYATFQDKTTIYMLMEYMPADLFSILNIVSKNRVSLSVAIFCVANVVITLEEIHSLGIIYRDLKPQNILLDWQGYPVLTDFGFSKIVNLQKCKQIQQETKNKKNKKKENGSHSDLSSLPPMTASFVGTPAYLAPEVLKREYYAEAVDCWALGILTYEMLLGDVPFDDTELTNEEMIDKMRKGVDFPKDFPKVAKDFITGLLNSKSGERFNLEQVKKHEFFDGINWVALKKKHVVSPFKKFIPEKKAPTQEPNTKNFGIYKLYEESTTNSTDDEVGDDISENVYVELFSGY